VQCGLCGFLIIKPQTALHLAMRYGAVHCYMRCGVVMPFYGWFWYGLCGFGVLVNTITCACIFNSRRICAQVAFIVLIYKEVLGVRSTGENNLLRSVLVAHEGAFLVILTYEEAFDDV